MEQIRQRLLVGALAVVVLGAGSYALFGNRSAPPAQAEPDRPIIVKHGPPEDAVTQAGTRPPKPATPTASTAPRPRPPTASDAPVQGKDRPKRSGKPPEKDKRPAAG